ncbi:MAG: hypothetical protein KIT84_37415 [Labilithrix sp.]|nr:hypothetical protein [Labilithrix sp.]MCW5816739.1 hypothetical protein [Labilithrix sp.]
MSDVTATTAPPPAHPSRELLRERIDHMTLRSFGERRVLRASRKNGATSVWDPLERAVVDAATALWESAGSDLVEDLGAYCAFLARELERNEQRDLPPAEETMRLCSLAPRALDALDVIAGPLLTERAEANPVTREMARAFGQIRAELMMATPHFTKAA